jgi:hypothetical protein
LSVLGQVIPCGCSQRYISFDPRNVFPSYPAIRSAT